VSSPSLGVAVVVEVAVVEAVSVTAVRGGGNPLVESGCGQVRAPNVREDVRVKHISRCVKHTCKHGNTYQ